MLIVYRVLSLSYPPSLPPSLSLSLSHTHQVDMPVFFYVDPEFNEDPNMAKVSTIILSYTFFEAKEGESMYSWISQKQ